MKIPDSLAPRRLAVRYQALSHGVLTAALLMSSAGCQRPSGPAAAEAGHAHELSLTAWSNTSEVFLAFPPLERGVSATAMVHWTRLADGKPMPIESGTLWLQSDTFQAQIALAPGNPGLAAASIKMARAGEYEVTVEAEYGGGRERVKLGRVTISDGSPAADSPEPQGIVLLKEQQWTLEVQTGLVGVRPVRACIRVPAEAQARAAGEMEVAAPLAGRVGSVTVSTVGSFVDQGQALAAVLPLTSAPGDLATLEQSRAESAAALEYARSDRLRAERLVEAGAAPARRLEEARAIEAAAEARQRAALVRLAQYDSSSAGHAESPGVKSFIIRAPIRGLITEVHTAAGKNVSAGELLYRVVDLDRIQVAAFVPESEMARAAQLSGAELEVPAREGRLPLPRPAWTGKLVDPGTRTFSILFPLDNRSAEVGLRQTLAVWIYFGGATPRPAVPEGAIVDDNGQPVVFRQQSGERFERRPVKLGARESGWVEITSGLTPGERIVLRGAYLVRLASLSPVVPGEGHVH